MVFIRAPKISHVGEGVEVIATEGADPVAVRQGSAMAATFHPELSEDTRVHKAFLDLVATQEFQTLNALSFRSGGQPIQRQNKPSQKTLDILIA